jgi:DNA invertase Pin-like site-specific DNA recombinase
MGYFKDIAIDIITMYREDGMKETEIAKSLGLSLTQVHDVLAAYESGDMDYSETDSDVVSYDDLVLEPNDENYNQEVQP